jgi:hypothetical protein
LDCVPPRTTRAAQRIDPAETHCGLDIRQNVDPGVGAGGRRGIARHSRPTPRNVRQTNLANPEPADYGKTGLFDFEPDRCRTLTAPTQTHPAE